MLRFAPSPTKELLLSDLRVALYNSIIAIQKNEDLIIRIEDIDQEKNIEGKDKEIVGLLDLFGIAYRDVIYQSANLKYHRSMAIQLLHEKIAFNCFCTPQTLQEKEEAARNEGRIYTYDDTCLSLTPEQTIDNESPFTVRLRKPNVNVHFTDKIKKEASFSPDEIDSFVILRTDKHPTYDFACAVDDMLSDISTVIRSEEYFSHTPKQIAARAALNYTKEIEYAHLPALLNQRGEKMGVEDEGASVKQLLEEGYLPQAIVNYLLLLGNRPSKEIFSLQEAAAWIDLSSLDTSPVTLDMQYLQEINRKHLAALDDVELSRYVGFADKDIGKLAKLYLSEVSTTKGLREKIGAIFSSKQLPEALSEHAQKLKTAIDSAPYFESYEDFIGYLTKQSELSNEELLTPLRMLLCGEKEGPDLAAIYGLIKNYLSEIVK